MTSTFMCGFHAMIVIIDIILHHHVLAFKKLEYSGVFFYIFIKKCLENDFEL